MPSSEHIIHARQKTNANTDPKQGVTFSTEMLTLIARQLQRMALAFTVAFSLAVLPGVIEDFVRAGALSTSTLIGLAVTLASSLVSLGVYWRVRSGRWPLAQMPSIGLRFGVLGAFMISFSENWGRFAPDWTVENVRWLSGTSWVCVWLTAFAILIPAEPKRVLRAALIAASMGPVGLALNLWLNGYRIPEGLEHMWVTLFWPNFVSALVSAASAKLTYRLRRDLQAAQDIGSYRLIERIGRGGMGEVWRAEHQLLACPAAVKLIQADLLRAPSAAKDPDALPRFKREARLTASLRSPHTIRIYDFGETSEDCLFYAMELLEGLNLDELIVRHGPQPPERVIHWLAQACLSLAEAHGRGLVHRDIKPANIFACVVGEEYDFIKVLDFGLVKRYGDPVLPSKALLSPEAIEDPYATAAGAIMGTPAFIAPEALENPQHLDRRADLYGLGAVAFWLLTGRTLFDMKTPHATLLAHVLNPPTPPSSHSPFSISPQLDALVLRCLAKAPADRPHDALALRQALLDLPNDSPWTEARARLWWREAALKPLDNPAEPDPFNTTLSALSATTQPHHNATQDTANALTMPPTPPPTFKRPADP